MTKSGGPNGPRQLSEAMSHAIGQILSMTMLYVSFQVPLRKISPGARLCPAHEHGAQVALFNFEYLVITARTHSTISFFISTMFADDVFTRNLVVQ